MQEMNNRRWLYEVSKRAMDLVLASVALLALSPVFLAVALLIKVDSPGPVLFRDRRLGQGRQEFTFLKFRSMLDGADPTVHEEYVCRHLSGQSAVPGAEETRAWIGPVSDPRITRLGRALRATCLDELPQFVNVLRGEMSLVGPRPPLPYEVEMYDDWHLLRLSVRPGLTGLWQVKGRGISDFEGMAKLDLEYIEKRSLWLDIKLILQTVPAILRTAASRQ